MVYLEAQDLVALTAKARESGQTLVEWAREVLRGEIGQDVQRLDEVPVGESRINGEQANGVSSVVREPRNVGPSCKHGKSKGHHCWQCGGIAVMA